MTIDRNVPFRYTQKAQDMRDWKKNQVDNNNFEYSKSQKSKYRKNYDEIDWSR